MKENTMTDDKNAEGRPDPFDEQTPNDPIDTSDWGRKMVGSIFRGCNMPNSRVDGCNMGQATFYQTNLDGCTFDDVGIRNSTLNNISLGNSKITNSCLTNLEIDGNLTGMVIQGIPLSDLFDAYEKVTGKKVD